MLRTFREECNKLGLDIVIPEPGKSIDAKDPGAKMSETK